MNCPYCNFKVIVRKSDDNFSRITCPDCNWDSGWCERGTDAYLLRNQAEILHKLDKVIQSLELRPDLALLRNRCHEKAL